MPSLGGALIGVGAPFCLVQFLRWRCSLPPHPRALALYAGGAATAFVALIAEDMIWPLVNPILPLRYAMVIRAFLMIALVEETAKLALIYGQTSDSEPGDYKTFAVLAAFVGAGFAGAENFLYIAAHGSGVALGRIVTATPFHICNAVVASRMLWLAARERKYWLAPAALASAVLLHGLYDYEIFTDTVGDGKFWFALALTGSLAFGLLRLRET